MNDKVVKVVANSIFMDLFKRYPMLQELEEEIYKAYDTLCYCYENGGKVLICGNGGSAADAGHMTAELMKGFLLPRKLQKTDVNNFSVADYSIAQRLQYGLPAISLSAQCELMTAISNDNGADMVFAQQVFGYAKSNDVFIGFSTSGNSLNVVQAAKTAKALQLPCIVFTGNNGGTLKTLADAKLCVPENMTYKIQELHLPIYHALCIAIEKRFFNN